jgi:membrane-bound metal-dependent hydrolase YbcI (DUF457 family)
MYAGHFAAGLALKGRVPRAPTWALLVGVVLIDLAFGAFVLCGVERATVTPGHSPGFRLDSIPWSHSLVASLAWAMAFALFFLPRGRAVVAAIAFAAFSHFLLDLPMHPGDMTLWPGSTVKLGFGLWTRLPIGWWFVELAFIACCCAYYFARARADQSFGRRAGWACLLVIALHVTNSPWLSPVK